MTQTLENLEAEYQKVWPANAYALRSVRDGLLYMQKQRSLDKYIEAETPWSNSQGFRLLFSVRVLDSLSILPVDIPRPANESQTRVFRKLKMAAWRPFWCAAVRSAPRKKNGAPHVTRMFLDSRLPGIGNSATLIPHSRNWAIYVITRNDGLCKVGVTSDIRRRVLEHVRACGPLSLYKSLPLGDRQEAYLIERMAHRVLTPCWVIGEWFKCSPQTALDAISAAVGAHLTLMQCRASICALTVTSEDVA